MNLKATLIVHAQRAAFWYRGEWEARVPNTLNILGFSCVPIHETIFVSVMAA
jgi:hypothetical protein